MPAQRTVSEDYSYLVDGVPLAGVLTRPSDAGANRGTILVVHDNKGMSPYITDVATDLARRGYAAVVPDLLTRVGGTASFASQDEVIGALGELDVADLAKDAVLSLRHLSIVERTPPGDPTGAVGFCFGGTVVWRVATLMPELAAAVPFYGKHPPLDDIHAIGARVLALYGELDERINRDIPEVDAAMAAAGKPFARHIYPGVGHAFHSPANPARYNPAVAESAWNTAVDWFDRWMIPIEATERQAT